MIVPDNTALNPPAFGPRVNAQTLDGFGGNMSDVSLPPIAGRIAAARQRVGLSHEEMASRLGISVPSYWDLEAYNSEVFGCISLAQLETLAGLLGIAPRALVSRDVDPPVATTVSLDEVASSIRRRIERDGDGGTALSDEAGVEIWALLVDAATMWREWCLEQLQMVCSPLGINWRAVLSEVASGGTV